MAKTNLPNNVSSGVPNVQNLIGEKTKYETLYKSTTRTQTGEGTFTSSTSGLSYTTNSYPSDSDVFNKGEEGLMNMFAKYVLVNYLLSGTEVQEILDDIDANVSDINSLQNTTSYGATVSGTDALTITTVNGGFTFAVGKSVKGIAVNNNTTSMTVDVDSDGALPIKTLDGSSYVDVEADVFEDNKPFELICQTDGVIGDFFLLAPKGKGGINFYETTTWYTNRTLAAYTQRLSVTGSGWIVSIFNSTTSADQVRLVIDGSNKDIVMVSSVGKTIMQRFETSFQLQANTNRIGIIYILDGADKSIENGTPKMWSPTTGTASTTIVNVSGEGWLFGVHGDNDNSAIDVLIDGVSVTGGVGYDKGNEVPMFFKFKTSLEVKAENATSTEVSYSLK